MFLLDLGLGLLHNVVRLSLGLNCLHQHVHLGIERHLVLGVNGNDRRHRLRNLGDGFRVHCWFTPDRGTLAVFLVGRPSLTRAVVLHWPVPVVFGRHYGKRRTLGVVMRLPVRSWSRRRAVWKAILVWGLWKVRRGNARHWCDRVGCSHHVLLGSHIWPRRRRLRNWPVVVCHQAVGHDIVVVAVAIWLRPATPRWGRRWLSREGHWKPRGG